MDSLLAVLFGFAFLYSLVAARLERTPIAAAIVFTAYGALVGPAGLDLLEVTVKGEALRRLAELTLAVVLFADAASADLGVLRRNARLPQRLLLIGLPLTILAGLGAAWWLLPGLGLMGAALLAVVLAPTDAALGKAVVTNPAVPAPIREALNVESGLNDGICVPVLLLLLALAGAEAKGLDDLFAEHVFLKAIGIGAEVGAGAAVLAVVLIRAAEARGWLGETWRPVTIPALALAIFGVAEGLHGSGFIACFVGGLLAGALLRRHDPHGRHALLLGAESTANVFALLTWVAFGAAAVGPALSHFGWDVLAYAALSLTLVRMVPVWLALAGSGTGTAARLFLGWFGPRGLASLVFAVMVMDAEVPGGEILVAAVAWTVLLSVLAHGLTAVPLATAFGRAAGPR